MLNSYLGKRFVFKSKNFKNDKFLLSVCGDLFVTLAKGQGAGSHHGGPLISLFRSKCKRFLKMVKTPKKKASKSRKSKK